MDQPTPPAVPPIQPGAMVRAKPASKWPTVIGIISIVFGAVGSLFGVCGIFGALSPATLQPGQPQSVIEASQKWAFWSGSSSILSAAVAVFLLVAGIQLLKRTPGAPHLCRVWAITKMIVALIGVGIGALVQQDTMAAVMETQSGSLAMSQSMMRGMMLGGLVISLLWAWALPVFMLIWFGQQTIKEETAQWGQDKAFPVTEPHTDDAL